MNLKVLREKRGDVVAELRAIADKYKGDDAAAWTPSDQRKFDELCRRDDELRAEIEKEEGKHKRLEGALRRRSAGLPAEPGDAEALAPLAPDFLRRLGATAPALPVPTDPRATRALEASESCTAFCRARASAVGEGAFLEGELSELRLGQALRAYLRGPKTDVERRALSEGTDSAGGYTVPNVLAAQVIDRLRPLSHVLSSGARIVPLSSDNHSFVKIATDPAATWRAENASVAESDATFGALTFTPKTLAVVVRASRELIEDSLNVEEALEMALARSFASELDRVALVGSGSGSEPTGIRNTSGVTEVSMGTNGAAITDYTEVLDLLRDLRAANAPEPGSAILAPRTMRTIDGFADTTGQPLQRPPALASNAFRPTSQVPIDETQGTATDASTLFFGDWAQVWLGVRTSFRLEVLRERYADNLQLGFLAYVRADVALAQAAAMGRLIGIVP